MKKNILLIGLTLLSFCSFSQITIVDSIFSGGMYRNYRLYVPAAYTGSSARPLIINMHGYTSNALQQQFYSNFTPIADTANFLMVFPNGTFSGTSQYWNAGISTAGANDIGFLSNLIDSLKASYNIDLNCVYSTGMSNGGFMSHTLACELSNRITAIASVTGSIFITQFGSNCHPTRPIPVMQVHGTADGTVPYIGNSTMVPVDSVVKYWVTKNSCNPVPSYSAVPNISTTDGCTADHYLYSGGSLGSTVELYKVNGGAHTWPGAPIAIGVTNQDFIASKEIWRFFRPFKLNALTNILHSEKENLNFKLFPNPAANTISLMFDGYENKTKTVVITSILGEQVSEAILTNDKVINVNKLDKGIYTLTLLIDGKGISNTKFIKE